MGLLRIVFFVFAVTSPFLMIIGGSTWLTYDSFNELMHPNMVFPGRSQHELYLILTLSIVTTVIAARLMLRQIVALACDQAARERIKTIHKNAYKD